MNTMTKAAHTAGPWTLKRGDGRYRDRLYVESHIYSTPTVISGKDQIVQLSSFQEGDETEANARLIAAAPELLAALQQAEIAVEQLCIGQDPANECWNILAQLRAAIAKTTGAA